MDAPTAVHVCPRCSQRFTHKSSQVRHSKRCAQGLKALSRQKACQHCSKAKMRCDMHRPTCGRCRARSLSCDFAPTAANHADTIYHTSDLPVSSPQAPEPRPAPSMLATPTSSSSHSPLPPPTPTPTTTTTNTIAAGLVISPQRRQELLGTTGSPRSSSSRDGARHHTLHVVIRILKSWPRLMAMHGASPSHLPPMMHPVQLEPHAAALPVPLANCFALAKLWAAHTRATAQLVHDAATQELHRLLHSYHAYGEADLLAAAQALLILMTILFFGLDLPDRSPDPNPAHIHDQAQTLIAVWDVKHALTLTGLFDAAELASPQRVPDDWKQWALVAAKRRTILALHHLEWAWSLVHGRAVLTCFELGPLPAPAAGCVWRARSEREWRGEYGGWLGRWGEESGGGYRMVEFFGIRAGEELGVRGEMWLAEADEFGVLLMAEGESVFGSPMLLVVEKVADERWLTQRSELPG